MSDSFLIAQLITSDVSHQSLYLVSSIAAMPLDPKLTEHFAKSAKDYTKQGLKGRTLTLDFFKLALDRGLVKPPITSSSVVHDNAAGPGIVTKELLARAKAAGQQPPKIISTDISAPMIDVLKESIAKEGWDTVTASVMDGKDLKGIESNSLTHSITNFGIFDCGVGETYRTLQPGGLAVISTWKTQPMVILANQVRRAIHPGLGSFPPGYGDEWWTREYLEGMIKEAGFKDAKIELLTLDEDRSDAEEMVEEMKGGFWVMARDGMTDEEKGRWDDVLRQKLEERASSGFTFETWFGIATKS